MPIYEYECETCGKFEKLQKMSEDALTECPSCGSQVHRVISKNVFIVFKGSGVYATDSPIRIKSEARAVNQERQKDNQSLLDGDVKGYVQQSESSDKKVAGA